MKSTKSPERGSASDPRLYVLNDRPVATVGAGTSAAAYVLYWCRAYRRAEDNLALDHAIERANALSLPLLVYEALDVRYPFASDRFHTFVLEGVAEMRSALEARGCHHAFYLPRTAEEAARSQALVKLAERAALVVTDWYPPAGGAKTLWAHTAATARKLSCRMEAYDDAVGVPMGLLQKHEIAARTIRPKVNALRETFCVPSDEPTVRAKRLSHFAPPFEPTVVTKASIATLVASCAIDHTVHPVAARHGGMKAAHSVLDAFIAKGLGGYADGRNDMALVQSSRLSPYLHFGHLSPRAAALRAMKKKGDGSEAFVEELLVRRALAFNHVQSDAHHATYATVPAWARETLAAHADDPRTGDHTLKEWEEARTNEPLWNTAQRELVRDGAIHPYARMLWGKVAITLTKRPETAFRWLVHLNDRYALDGRDPNSYGNIAWCFGLHDHPFPERKIFGKVRSMTTKSAAQKWDTEAYVKRVEG